MSSYREAPSGGSVLRVEVSLRTGLAVCTLSVGCPRIVEACSKVVCGDDGNLTQIEHEQNDHAIDLVLLCQHTYLT